MHYRLRLVPLLAVALVASCAGDDTTDSDEGADTAATSDAGNSDLGDGSDVAEPSSDAGKSVADTIDAPDIGATDAGTAADTSTTCSAGERICVTSTPYGYKKCLADGTWQPGVCPGADQVCKAGQCVKAVCPPGQKYCEDGKQKVCAANGLSATFGEHCTALGKVCAGGICVDEKCTSGSSKCAGNAIVKCSGTGTIETILPCKAGEGCDDGVCAKLLCDPNKHVCDGNKKTLCSAGGTKQTVIEDCAASSKVCATGACEKVVCDAGKAFCNGDEAMVCHSKGISAKKTATCAAGSEACVDGKCLPTICTPGEKSCESLKPKTCNKTGTAWLHGTCPKLMVCAKKKCETPLCTIPTKWPGQTQVIRKMKIPSDAVGACDLNGDKKPDNALGIAAKAFASQIQGSIDYNIKNGIDAMVLYTPTAWTTKGTPMQMHLLYADVSPVGGCSPATSAQCKLKLQSDTYNLAGAQGVPCVPLTVAGDFKVTGDKMQVTGTGGKHLLFSMPLLGFKLTFKLYDYTVTGTVKDGSGWKTTTNGRMCGRILKADIDKSIDALDPVKLKAQGFDKATVKVLLNSVLKADIDADGNGTNESLSAYITFESHGAKIIGF